MRNTLQILMLAAIIGGWGIPAMAQQYPGEVSGWLSGAAHKYNGEFTDDLWGTGAMVSVQYAPISRLGIEARFGLGEIRWKISQNDVASYPQYFGQGNSLGGLYPGTLTTIEPENESRISTIDLLVNYTIVDGLPAIPFISAGVGLVDFAPSTAEAHDALPNLATKVYTPTTASIPVGGGVRIPFSYRAGLVLRGEYRFVFSPYLDDVDFGGGNDGITTVTLGFSYRFTNPPRPRPVLPPHHHRRHHHHCECAKHPDHAIADCPCHDELSGVDGENGERETGPTTFPVGPDPSDTGATKSSADSQKPPNTTNDSTPSGGASGDGKSSEPNTPGSTPSNVPQAPCPPGTARLCVEDNKSVCVDTTFKPGAERIRWEDAFVWDPADPANGRTLRQAGAESPCYSIVVRQTAAGYYLCKDCCFQRQPLGDGFVYVILEQGMLVKGAGTYSPENCPNCPKLVSEGR